MAKRKLGSIHHFIKSVKRERHGDQRVCDRKRETEPREDLEANGKHEADEGWELMGLQGSQ